jgi:succinate-semialdehyde dehydrogenase/glutarate-semialdehyde dehydrogenase
LRSLVGPFTHIRRSIHHPDILADPSSGKLIGTAPEMDADDTKKAIDAAAAAFPSFRATTGRERSKMLRKWYDLMV